MALITSSSLASLFTHKKSQVQRLCTATVFFFVACLSAHTAVADKKTDVKTKAEKPQVLFQTSLGDIVIELYPKEAPITVKNFLQYVDNGFYEDTIFHRVIPGFVVQGGGFTFDFQRKQTRDPIKNESDNGLKNLVATLSMARTGVIDSATSQFFINLQNNRSLDFTKGRHGYAVFGKVVKGMDVVKKITKQPRGIFKSFPEAPNYAVVVEKTKRL